MRHLQRYREIAVAFSRNGFGYIVKGLGLDQLFTLPRRVFVNRDQDVKQGKTTGQRIRAFLEELGPTFIKMGQMLSTRPDIIPKEIIQELEQLQDQLHPIPFAEVEAVLQKELEDPVKKVLKEIDPEPIGVASIGQVHQAVLLSGERVAIKVQRPNIEKNIHTDLEILHELAKRAEKRLAWASRYQLIDMVEEFSKSIEAELDFVSDGRNADLMGQQFKDNPNIVIPQVYWQHTTEKVLTMEYIAGCKMNDVEHLKKEGYQPEQLAEHLVQTVFHQIFKDGFFHADPHSGNLTALPGNRIGLFDFGMVGRLSQEMKKHLASLVIALIKQDTDDMIRAIKKMGAVPEQINIHELKGDIEQVNIKYYGVSLSDISLGESVTELLTVANKHKIRIPTDLTMIGKTLLSLEGIIEQLHPELSIMDAAEPFGRELIKERYHPKQIAEEIFDQMHEYGEIVHDMPQIVQELANMVKQRKMPIEISIPEAKSFFSKLDRVSNRLSFSIVLLSFSLIMVGLIIGSALGRQTSLLWDIPAIEIGFVIAMLMFAWLIYSIFRSGRF
ncbi:AarF/ABC1/UbiB kinase family protein [Gracilibacillus caseinilyticus]|uniref:AarF/ABC1/UbiB kinase family protein n=1 Tax=Gracilibacillus caseinilyticus TaxID=2932256 RepID=A0ABY4F1I0_9BACI|nr:AarF/ABC1/UbiB kinase family protein [Gracilibacillus caseinilyticus]UOQ49922.1 AarF/ABC1/UbiB kinase family protein [Gracilibacillus caseinilyticus]